MIIQFLVTVLKSIEKRLIYFCWETIVFFSRLVNKVVIVIHTVIFGIQFFL